MARRRESLPDRVSSNFGSAEMNWRDSNQADALKSIKLWILSSSRRNTGISIPAGFPVAMELRIVITAGESSPLPIWAMELAARFQKVSPILEILSGPWVSWMVSPKIVQSPMRSWVRVSMARLPSGLMISG